MTKKLTPAGFRRTVEEKDFHTILFDTDNTPWEERDDTLYIRQTFSDVRVFLDPVLGSSVAMKGETGNVSLRKVRYVEQEEPSRLGEVFRVVCGDEGQPPRVTTLIMR